MKCLTVDEIKDKVDNGEMSASEANAYIKKYMERIINVTRRAYLNAQRRKIIEATNWNDVKKYGTKMINFNV